MYLKCEIELYSKSLFSYLGTQLYHNLSTGHNTSYVYQDVKYIKGADPGMICDMMKKFNLQMYLISFIVRMEQYRKKCYIST